MLATDSVRGYIWQGTACVLLGRLRNLSGAYLTQASLTSIAYKVVDLKAIPAAVINSGTFVIGSVIFDTLQTDARWQIDATGYNFAATLTGSNFPNAATAYRVQVTFTQTDANAFIGSWQPTTYQVF